MKKPIAEFRIFGLSGLRSAAYRVLCLGSIFVATVLCVAVALLPAPPARGQRASQTVPPYMDRPNSRFPGASSRHNPQSRFPRDDDTTYIDSVRLRQLKAVRAKALFKDTDKLLKLATELNAEVGGDKAGPPGKAQLRKVSKIAKLARKVEENMKLVIVPRRRSPVFFPNPFPGRAPNHH